MDALLHIFKISDLPQDVVAILSQYFGWNPSLDQLITANIKSIKIPAYFFDLLLS